MTTREKEILLHKMEMASIGLAYGYPSCCALWFVSEWYDARTRYIMTHPESLFSAKRDPILEWFYRAGGSSGFIPCPTCGVRRMKERSA